MSGTKTLTYTAARTRGRGLIRNWLLALWVFVCLKVRRIVYTCSNLGRGYLISAIIIRRVSIVLFFICTQLTSEKPCSIDIMNCFVFGFFVGFVENDFEGYTIQRRVTLLEEHDLKKKKKITFSMFETQCTIMCAFRRFDNLNKKIYVVYDFDWTCYGINLSPKYY